MDQICGTPFWNSSVSWDGESPFVSQCFQHLVLVLGSCGVLWIVAPFEFYKICTFHGRPSPWTKLSIAKITLKVLLLLICSLDLSISVFSYLTYPDNGIDGLISSVAFFLTIVLTIVITLLCKSRGLRVSLALPSFWMLSTLSTLICIYNDIQGFDKDDWRKVTSLVDDGLTFFISIIQLILSNVADKRTPSRGREIKDKCPLEGVSLPSRLTFSWLMGLLTKSIQNSLHQDYLIPLCSELRSSSVIKSFYEACLSKKRDVSSSFTDGRASREQINSFEPNFENQESFSSSYPNGKSLFMILLKMSKKFLAIAFISEIVYTLLYYIPAYILNQLLDKEKQDWHNYLYASALFITLIFSTFADSQRKYYGLMGAMRIKTAVMNAVFEKALKVSQLSKSVKSLLTSDSDNVFKMICLMSDVWGSSIRLIVGIYIFWNFLGTSCFVGICTAALFIPLNVIVEHGANYYQKRALYKRTERIGLLRECLEGRKVLKLYAWDEIFRAKLMSIRKSEISELRKAGFLKMIFKFIYLSATSIVMLTSLTVHVLTGNLIDVKTIFVSLLLIFLLKPPFRSILHLFAHYVQGLQSMSQIQKFLEAKEQINISIEDSTDEENRVVLSNASFSWNGADIPLLKNLHLRIPKGALVAIVGETGCGKSSLLRALLGELQIIEGGTASVLGQLAYVSDEPWIQNTTLEKNILFLKPKVEKVYRRILEACDLDEDIETLPAGHETEIGEMGVHLTREQKLKVELARTVYQNADIYLLDNPLQHLDSVLAEHIFYRVIGRSGLLKEKTRILVTTKEEFLPLVDFILVMKNGRILEKGTYCQLKDKDGHLSEYFRTMRSPQPTARNSTSSNCRKENLMNASSFGKQTDVWYSAAVKPCTMNLEHSSTNGTTQGFGHKLMDILKTIGFALTPISILLAGLACACEAASGVWLSEWTDGNGDGQEPSHNLLIYCGFILSQVFLTIVCGISVFASSTHAAEKLHTWLLLQVTRASQTAFEMTPCIKIIQSFDGDFHSMDEQIPETFYVWLMACLRAPALLVVVFVVSPFAGVMSTTLVFAFLVIQKLYLNTWQQMQHLTSSTSCPLSSLLDDTLRGASSIRATRSYYHFLNRFQIKVDTHHNCSLIFLLVSRWLSNSVDIITAFLVLWTSVMGFYERDQGDGFLGLAIVFSMQMAETLTNAVYMSSMLNNDLTPFERLKSLSEIKQESEWEDPANIPPPSWPESGSILIENLNTAYGEGMHPVLHHINISIKPGEKVAIVGKEESGISTLLYSIFRLIEPQEGSIIIDNLDISKLGLRDLRSRLAIIPQDIFLFKGTVRENLNPRNEFDEDELWLALEVVGLKSCITNLDSSIEEYNFADKYLFGVCRCVLKKPKIIIIEEFETPDKIMQFFPDSTVLVFSSNPIQNFHGRIIKLISGEVISQEFSSNQ